DHLGNELAETLGLLDCCLKISERLPRNIWREDRRGQNLHYHIRAIGIDVDRDPGLNLGFRLCELRQNQAIAVHTTIAPLLSYTDGDLSTSSSIMALMALSNADRPSIRSVAISLSSIMSPVAFRLATALATFHASTGLSP